MSKPMPPTRLDFLLANICHLHHGRASQQLEALNLYRGQPPVLRVLWQEEGLTQSELAERLHISTATLTRMLQRMERSGFIRRQPDSQDQRAMRVFLTGAGRAIQDKLEQVWETLEAETFANFTPEESAVLRRFLLQIRENLLRASGEQPWE